MALPHLPSHYNLRKNIYEATIVNRRTRESDYRNKWSDTAKYFHDNNVEVGKQITWQSDSSFESSMNAYTAKKDKERKEINLKRRRLKLSELLQAERTGFQKELKNFSTVRDSQIEDMKEKSHSLKSAREKQRKELADQLLYEHWRVNSPDLRAIESKQHENHVVNSWADQLEEQKELKLQEKLEREAEERRAEERRLESERIAQERERARIQREADLKEVLISQIQELKQRERQSEQLKRDEELLERQQWEHVKLDEERKSMEKSRKNQELGRILLRQHTAALKRKSQLIQKELEEDKIFLQGMVQAEQADREIQSVRREKARADAEWMQQVIEEQIKLEKEREAELELLYQDEAARLWQKREEEWAKERKAREKLMNEVMNERQLQLEEKLDRVHANQKASLEERERLVRQIEYADQLTKRDLQQVDADREKRKSELDAQVAQREEEKREEDLRLRLEEEDKREAEENYERMLSDEAENLSVRGYQPSSHRINRKQAWI